MNAAVTFGYRGLVLRAECASEAAVAWLTEFLAPSFAPSVAGPPDFNVELVADEDRHRAALARGALPVGEPVACFALDGDMLRLPRVPSAAGEVTVVDQPARLAYVVRGQRISVLADRLAPSRRIGWMRVVRELAMSEAWTAHSGVLHAAALEVDGIAVLIAGTKGAGKTTLLTQLLLAGAPSTFIANDRVVVDVDGGVTRVRGMPTVVQIQPGTLEILRHLHPRLARNSWDHRTSLAESVERTAPWERGRALQLTPAQLCSLLECRSVDGGRVGVLLLPRLAAAGEQPALRRLSPAAAAERLADLWIGVAAGGPSRSEVFCRGSAEGPALAKLGALAGALTRDLRSFECSLANTSAVADAAQSILGAIRERRAA